MWPFGKRKKESHNIKVEMKGYENGKEVKLKFSKPSTPEMSIETLKTIKKEIYPLETIMVSYATALKTKKPVSERISDLNNLIFTYEKIRKKCISLGEEYEKYFYNSWEKRSSSDGLTYIERFIKELNELEQNFYALREAEKRHQRESVNLKSRLLNVIKDNPGIKQSEIYKFFDGSVKEDIRSILYFSEKDGTVKREKTGNTYKVFYKRNK